MRKGGTLFTESQTVKGVPVQASYDAIFGTGEIRVLEEVLSGPERRGPRAIVCRASAKHPLANGVSSPLAAQYQAPDMPLFNIRWTGTEQLERPVPEQYTDSIWIGWFTRWAKGWIPILEAELPPSYRARNAWRVPPHAILLAKCEENGLLLASTMWLAASRPKVLIQHVINCPKQDIQRFHRRARIKRAGIDFLYLILLFAILSLLTWGFVLSAFWLNSMGKWGTLGLSALGVGLLPIYISSFSIYRRFVLARPYGISIWKTLLYETVKRQ